MPKKKIFEDIENQESIDTSKWSVVLVDNLPEDRKQIFLLRKKAIDMYFADKPIREISKETNLHRNSITKLAKRCLELDNSGTPYGYNALIPYKRIRKHTMIAKKHKGCSGSFSALLDNYPQLQELIINQYLGINKKRVLEPNIRVNTLHSKFIRKCHQLNIREDEYPFNTIDKGKRSLYRYTNNLKNLYYDKYTKRYGNYAYGRLNSTGVGIPNNPIITRPFQQVQFDGHRIDMIISVKFKTIEGDTIVNPMSRIWLLVIIDVATRVILGYHLCLNSEYSSADVLRCIQNAIVPKEKKKFTIPNFKYPSNGGFHSLFIPETMWAVWDEFLYDNAKANLAKNVTDKLTQVVKCSINAGPVATPERRGLIERFFRTLEENGYHRIVSTVGSNPTDPRRNNPEKSSITYEILENEIEELTEILIANYNNTPHDGINGFSPLELMRQRIERGQIPRTIAPYDRNDLTFLSLKIQRKICGSIKCGRRPYIIYEGVQYRNDVLSKMPDLIGQKLTLLVNINDLRSIKAYLSNGSELGMLTASGKWGIKPHTLKMRKEINKLKKNKYIHINSTDDPIEIYHEFLIKKSVKNKTSRNKLAILEKTATQLPDRINDNGLTAAKCSEKNNKPSKKESQFNDIDNNKIEELKKSNMFKTLNL